MWDIIFTWLGASARLLHVVTAIAWVGSSFYFIWLDLSLRRHDGLSDDVQGENWSVHGGGFYHSQKYVKAPPHYPKILHWFKWESYMTWLSGFLLIILYYYIDAAYYLVDPSVLDIKPLYAILLSIGSLIIGWVVYHALCQILLEKPLLLLALLWLFFIGMSSIYSEIFAPRAALLHVGAMMATIMSANVAMVIIPNQKKNVQLLKNGETPDARLSMIAKNRSTHNNYLVLPVIFFMLSNHYSMIYTVDNIAVLVALILLAGAFIRDYFNSKTAGKKGIRLRWQWPSIAVLFCLMVAYTIWDKEALNPPQAPQETTNILADNAVIAMIDTHCAACHAQNPSHSDFSEPPANIMLTSLADIMRHQQAIKEHSVLDNYMPLGNETNMTMAERAALGAWIEHHAK